MPAKYPNQKHITVFKEPCSSKNIYAMINIEAMKNAAQQLKSAAFKLWMYFAKNQQHYELDLSSKVVESEFGMKKDMYDNAVHELIDKGFLILQQGKTIYHFYELPSPLHMPKVGKTPAEKQESTTSNNTINETDGEPNTPFQGVSSLPRNHTKYASMDALKCPPAIKLSHPLKRLTFIRNSWNTISMSSIWETMLSSSPAGSSSEL